MLDSALYAQHSREICSTKFEWQPNSYSPFVFTGVNTSFNKCFLWHIHCQCRTVFLDTWFTLNQFWNWFDSVQFNELELTCTEINLTSIHLTISNEIKLQRMSEILIVWSMWNRSTSNYIKFNWKNNEIINWWVQLNEIQSDELYDVNLILPNPIQFRTKKAHVHCTNVMSIYRF